MYTHRLHEFIFMETILYFKCKCYVHVPLIVSKFFSNKYLVSKSSGEMRSAP